MGRARPRAALGLAFAFGLCGVVLAGDAEAPLAAMRWAGRDADPLRAFGQSPTECLKPPDDAAMRRKVEVGRAAFRTPVVLGGQAARAGISCETCHRAGRSNPDFLFPGVSGAAGTADVTSSLFSSHRGNGRDDPMPIPDLSGPKAGLKVDHAPAAAKLAPFIHGLIVEEFDGPEPTPAVLEGLAAYVRALDPAHCPTAAAQPVTLALLMADARRAMAAAEAELAAGDAPTAASMVAAARARLGLIHERYAGDGLARLRERLREADRSLAGIQADLRAGRADAPRRLARWVRDSRRLETELAAREPLSLFNPQRLAKAATRRLQGKAS